jgi:NADH-ubiquinone oxidoreductase chain 2
MIGGVLGLAQYRIKRVLAYSAISHIGFLLLALTIQSEAALEGFIFYLFQYVLTSANIFTVLVAFYELDPDPRVRSDKIGEVSPPILLIQNSDPTDSPLTRGRLNTLNKPRIRDLPILNIQNHHALGVTFAISLFSLAGIPPLVGFFGKVMVLYTAAHTGYLFVSTLGVLVSVLSAAYYMRVIRILFFDLGGISLAQLLNTSHVKGGSAPQDPEQDPGGPISMLISTLTLSIIMFLAYPQPILNSLHLIALSEISR